jgi:hypothetical protein
MTIRISEELWRLYGSAFLEVEIEPGRWWTLFDPSLGLMLPDSLDGELAQGPAALVTAWNPYSLPRSLDENIAANEKLASLLCSSGYLVRAALGRSGDLTYREPGFYVCGVSVAQMSSIALRFHQNAIYLVSRLEILCVASDLSSFRRLG